MEQIEFCGNDGHTFRIRVHRGGSGPELLFLHGAGGLLPDDPFLNALMAHFRVTAPLLPGFEDSDGSEHLREMLDFTLHAYDVCKALDIHRPFVVGHSMGGMIAAEMASVAPDQVAGLCLLAPAGLWLEEAPIVDLFAVLPYELPELLFHDPAKHGNLLSAGGDLNDPEFLTEFMVTNARRLGTASKLLFPVPDRGLVSRLYRVNVPSAVVWGASDRLIPVAYAQAFVDKITDASLHVIEDAGHMVPYEQTEAVIEVIRQTQLTSARSS